MSAYAYRIVNVFTQGRAPLSGNPLCVFERAQELDAARMQALALQFNLSETTFILPSERASARVRIFTPSYEMPFAGHPALGTAHVCRALGLGGVAGPDRGGDFRRRIAHFLGEGGDLAPRFGEVFVDIRRKRLQRRDVDHPHLVG